MATYRSPTSAPQSRPRRRLGVAALVLAPLLAGCGTGFQAQTNQIYQPGPGVSVRDDDVYAINALVVTDGNGNGTLSVALINQVARPDRLVGVAVKTASGRALEATIAGRTIDLPSQTSVQLGATGDVRVKGALLAGSFGTLTLTFRNAAPVDVGIPIVANSAEFASVPIGPAP